MVLRPSPESLPGSSLGLLLRDTFQSVVSFCSLLFSLQEVAGTGIRWSYAPVLSLCRDPRWGRCYETFSEAQEVAAPLGAAAVAAWQVKGGGR